MLAPDAARRDRLLILLTGEQNRRILAARLSDRYAIVDFDALDADDPDGPFDLCIVDGMSLQRYGTALRRERERRDPLFVPVLLLTDRREAGLAGGSAWRIADDVLIRPVEPIELATRLRTMLRTRHLTLRLRNLSSMYEAERRVTARFQEAALPRALPEIPGLRLSAFYHAATDEARIGGDWYDATRLPDGRIVFSIGDVSGSGLDAAVTMGSVRQMLRGVAHVDPHPVLMLDAAQRAIGSDDPERIVTAFVGVLDPVTAQLVYAGAGHPRPLLRHKGRWRELASTGLPLGLASEVVRTAELTEMTDEAVLVLYTDGLTEATRDVLAGERRLHDVLNRSDIWHEANVARAIYDACVPEGAHDDVAILVLQREREGAGPIEQWTFAAGDARSAARTRQIVAGRLTLFGFAPEAIALAEVVYSELLGNVVRHAPGDVTVALDTSGPAPVLHVLDSGAGFRHLPKLPDDVLSERGRGLYIVSALTEDFTVTRRPHGGSHARAVLAIRERAPVPFEALAAFTDLERSTGKP